MRRIVALLALLLFAACATPALDRGQLQPAGQDAALEYLLAADGGKQYMLCGCFLPEGEADWVPFATIKTSDYEQWIGGQAAPFCAQAAAVWIEGDLSSALQSRLDALR